MSSAATEPCPNCRQRFRDPPAVMPGWDFPCSACGAMLARVEPGTEWTPPPRRPVDGPGPQRLLWVAIAGLLLVGLGGPVAWRMAHRYRQDCARLGVRPPPTVTAGWILGMVGTVVLVAFGCTVASVLVPVLMLKG